MEDLALIKAVNHSGSFGKNFVIFMKKKTVIHRPRSVGIGKNYALCLEYRPRPTASGGTQDFVHCFSQYRPPGGRITYIRVPEIELKATGHVKYMYIDLLAFLIEKLRYKGSQSIANRLPRAMLSRST